MRFPSTGCLPPIGVRKALVVVFVALLEMVFLQAIVLVQKRRFGEIVARRKKRFTQVMGDLDHGRAGFKRQSRAGHPDIEVVSEEWLEEWLVASGEWIVIQSVR